VPPRSIRFLTDDSLPSGTQIIAILHEIEAHLNRLITAPTDQHGHPVDEKSGELLERELRRTYYIRPIVYRGRSFFG
ncbi:hypothetical protein, partial [Bradyrhizobium yuanmingense]|uniref:hypothetical protein n=1 Tax=Bradyrhizobium yuanmingense TaxID=108015 RepID=UPI001AEBE583